MLVLTSFYIISETSGGTSVEETGTCKILGCRFWKCLRIRTSTDTVINSLSYFYLCFILNFYNKSLDYF